jgi:hypothetical protein
LAAKIHRCQSNFQIISISTYKRSRFLLIFLTFNYKRHKPTIFVISLMAHFWGMEKSACVACCFVLEGMWGVKTKDMARVLIYVKRKKACIRYECIVNMLHKYRRRRWNNILNRWFVAKFFNFVIKVSTFKVAVFSSIKTDIKFVLVHHKYTMFSRIVVKVIYILCLLTAFLLTVKGIVC